MIRKIVTFPAPILREKARPIKKFPLSLERLVEDMFETMAANEGIGDLRVKARCFLLSEPVLEAGVEGASFTQYGSLYEPIDSSLEIGNYAQSLSVLCAVGGTRKEAHKRWTSRSPCG